MAGWPVVMLWLGAAAAAPASGQALPAPSAPPTGAALMMHVSLFRPAGPPGTTPPANIGPRRFAEAARNIESCEQALAFARTTGAQVMFTGLAGWPEVPPPLRAALASVPLGRASPPYGTRGRVVRVLILCPASFRVPTPPPRPPRTT